MIDILIFTVLMTTIVALVIDLGISAKDGGIREQLAFLIGAMAFSIAIFSISFSEVGESDKYVEAKEIEQTEQIEQVEIRP